MGTGASFLDLDDDVRAEVYQEMKNIYENDYLPKVRRGEMKEGEEYNAFRTKIIEFLDSKHISKEKLLDIEAEPVHTFHNAPFSVGDVVKARDGGMMFEGVVISILEDLVEVDFGDAVETVKIENCSLVMSGLEFEVGDQVEYTPPRTMLHFVGTIIDIDTNTLKCSVRMAGEDPDDIEYEVDFSSLRKVKTGRELTGKFKRGINLIMAVNRMKGSSGSGSPSKK
jgi:hypothetical protein